MLRTPILIICHNQLTPLQKLINWLERAELTNIHIVDNQSTYKPLLDYFNQIPYDVIRCDYNAGEYAPWIFAIHLMYAPFVITDADILPIEECPLDVLMKFNIILASSTYCKVGFSLQLNDIPDCYSEKPALIRQEAAYWKDFDDRYKVYRAPIYTSFALYRAQTAFNSYESARVTFPYTARNGRWYVDSKCPTEEQQYYD